MEANHETGITLSPEDEHHLSLSLIERAAYDRDEALRRVTYLEKQNRKLTDRINRFRNVAPGRKRLIALGRIAAFMEYEADQILKTSPGDGSGDQPSHGDYRALVEDALFLRRLQWDFEQLIDVIWEPKQARHVWPRP